MGFWHDELKIYVRDFAYADNGPFIVRMAPDNIGDASAKTFAELLSGPTVDIYVGEQRRCWTLHRNLLCHHSDALAKELLPANTESPTPSPTRTRKGSVNVVKDESDKALKVELPHEDPAGFELLVKYLYQGRIDSVSDVFSDNTKYEYAAACHKLYSLCVRLDMPFLKNQAIDQYRQGLSEASLVPDAEEINEIYRNSPKDSPFRRLMVRIAARQIMDPYSDKNAESYRVCFEDNTDFAIELVNSVKDETGGVLFDDPTEGDDCEYHDHDSGMGCHFKGKGKIQDPVPASAERPAAADVAVSNVNGARQNQPSQLSTTGHQAAPVVPAAMNGAPKPRSESQQIPQRQQKPPTESPVSSAANANSDASPASRMVHAAPQSTVARSVAINGVRSGAGLPSSVQAFVNGTNLDRTSAANGVTPRPKTMSMNGATMSAPTTMNRTKGLPPPKKGPPKLRKQSF